MKRVKSFLLMVGGVSVAAILFWVNLGAAPKTAITPAEGFAYTPFQYIATDTAATLPSNNRGSGLVDTTNRRTGFIKIWARGGALRYSFGAVKPTRKFQTVMQIDTTVVAKDTLNKTAIVITANTFRDSQYVTLKNTSHSDGTYLITNKYTDQIVIDKAFAADTFYTGDSAFTPQFGLKLWPYQERTIFSEWIPGFRCENYDSGAPCTLNILHGIYAN